MRILIRGLAGRVLLLIGGLFGVLLLLEAVLSTLPVQDGPNAELRSDDPAVWFEPDRRFTWSKGWRMERVNELRTNNLGWVSSIDYDPDAIGPLLVVGLPPPAALGVPLEKPPGLGILEEPLQRGDREWGGEVLHD
ncbi:MAG: hypothetical protein IH884_07860 [Myxococcales bacterium]|nr:hypothetical protein [Myxococcales bacterium]